MIQHSQQTRMEERSALIRDSMTWEQDREELLDAINRLARVPLREDQIHVRSMYLCSSRLCIQDWSRFSLNALRRICSLIIGQSVIVGHDRSRLPIARFFKAEVVHRDDDAQDEQGEPVHWVRAWFYWLRETSGGRDLLLNIDGGIYREVSLSWRYPGGICSICNEQIQKCPHVPGQLYRGERCTFLMDDVSEVLEGSIVYKGAEPHTRFEGSHGERSTLEEQKSSINHLTASSTRDMVGYENALRLLFRQPRHRQSILILTDRPSETWGIVFAAKQTGRNIRGICLLNPADGCDRILGGVDWRKWEDERNENCTADLLWLHLENMEACDPRQSAWKRLIRKFQSCIWQDPPGNKVNSASRKSILDYFPSPLWQMRTSKEANAIELIREAS